MWIYILIFIIIFILYNLSLKKKLGGKEFSLFVMLVLGTFVGLGDMLGGYDRYIYGQIFDNSADLRIEGKGVNDVLYQVGSFEEKGYMLYNYLLSYITVNRYIFIFITSIIIFLCFSYAFKKYIRSNIIYAILLFLGLYFYFTFTYLREVIAVCISLFALKFVIERKLLWFLVIVFISYSFHHSALLLLIIYFVPLKKWSVKAIVTVALICFVLGVLGVSSIGFTAFSAISGGDARADMYVKEFDVEGYFRVDYIIESSFFLTCILIHYNTIGNDRRSLTFLNYALAFCFILLLFTQSAQGGRLSWYFLIGIIVLITDVVHENYTQWRLLLLCVSFLLFLRITYEWDYQIRPYKTFLTDGFRKNDIIHERFEYDHNYDKDKFYRPAFVLFSRDDYRNPSVQ